MNETEVAVPDKVCTVTYIIAKTKNDKNPKRKTEIQIAAISKRKTEISEKHTQKNSVQTPYEKHLNTVRFIDFQ